MKNDTILVLASPTEPQLAQLDALRPGVQIIAGDSIAAFQRAAAEATVILNWSGSLDLFRGVFKLSPNLGWVHIRSAGLDKALFPELLQSTVPLTNGRGIFSQSLAEFTLAAILYFAKDFRRMIHNQEAGVWQPFDVIPIAGQRVGIIGYGDIGRAVAQKVHHMDMKVAALKRNISPSQESDPWVDEIYGFDRVIEMISRCDYVVVATPLTAETRNLIGEPELAAMKPSAVIINVGRGPVINEDAMVKALVNRRIKGAALDVFDQEPLPARHPFYKLANVLLSPHCADHTPDWLEDAMKFFIAQFDRFRNGQPLVNLIDKSKGY
jgi:phosphoglycerate dehydrogenase-like enzyme